MRVSEGTRDERSFNIFLLPIWLSSLHQIRLDLGVQFQGSDLTNMLAVTPGLSGDLVWVQLYQSHCATLGWDTVTNGRTVAGKYWLV